MHFYLVHFYLVVHLIFISAENIVTGHFYFIFLFY